MSLNKPSGDRSVDYKKGLNESDSRRQRENGLLNLRHQKREEAIAKRRQKLGTEEPTQKVSFEKIQSLSNGIMGEDYKTQLKCTNMLRRIISNKEFPPIDDVIKSGVMPRLVQFLDMTDKEDLVFESAWILTNIASGTSENTQALINLDSVPRFVKLLQSPNIKIAEQSCWALGNISGDGNAMRDIVINCGAMEPLLNLYMRSKELAIMRTATWTLSNLCRGKPDPPLQQMKKCLPFLANLLKIDDKEIVVDAAWSVSFICDDDTPNNERIEAVVQSGLLPHVIHLLLNKKMDNTIKNPLLRILGNIITGSDKQTQYALDLNSLAVFAQIINSNNQSLRKEAVWTISNIAAGTEEQLKVLLDSGIVKSVCDSFAGESFEVKKEIAWVVSNIITCREREIIEYIIKIGGIKILCDLLASSDERTITVCLEGLRNFLYVGERIASMSKEHNKWAEYVEEVGGLDHLEQLQLSASQYNYEMAVDIINKHFSGDSGLEEIAPVEVGDTFSFGNVAEPGSGEFKFFF